MALTTRDALLNLGMIHSVAPSDLLASYAFTSVDKPRLGALAWANDSFGLRIFRAGRILESGGMTQGELADRVADVTGTVTAAAGETNDTTHLADTTNFTANNEEGKVCQINVAGAAAPEGECAFITDNSASQLTFDSGYPLSAAPESGDTYTDWGLNHWNNGALDTNAIDVGGIVMSDPSTTGDIAWLQIYGFHPGVRVDDAGGAPTAGAAGVAGATAWIRVRNAETVEDFIGYFPLATSSTATVAGFFIDLFNRSHPIA